MAQKNYKSVDQNQFVVTGASVDRIFKGGSFTISAGYTDESGKIKDKDNPTGSKGRYVEYVPSRDEKGRDKPKRFTFNQSLGRILTRPNDTDIYGRSQYEFLKNHPECEGSPNGSYEVGEGGAKTQTGFTFRELNSAADAKIALKADRLRNAAENNALNLDEQTLQEVANIIGYFGEVDDQMVLSVVEFARKKPGEFNEIFEMEDRSVRAIIRKALDESIFRKQGELIKWDATIIGNDENDAVSFLRKTPEVLTSLQAKLNFSVTPSKSKK